MKRHLLLLLYFFMSIEILAQSLQWHKDIFNRSTNAFSSEFVDPRFTTNFSCKSSNVFAYNLNDQHDFLFLNHRKFHIDCHGNSYIYHFDSTLFYNYDSVKACSYCSITHPRKAFENPAFYPNLILTNLNPEGQIKSQRTFYLDSVVIPYISRTVDMDQNQYFIGRVNASDIDLSNPNYPYFRRSDSMYSFIFCVDSQLQIKWKKFSPCRQPNGMMDNGLLGIGFDNLHNLRVFGFYEDSFDIGVSQVDKRYHPTGTNYQQYLDRDGNVTSTIIYNDIFLYWDKAIDTIPKVTNQRNCFPSPNLNEISNRGRYFKSFFYNSNSNNDYHHNYMNFLFMKDTSVLIEYQRIIYSKTFNISKTLRTNQINQVLVKLSPKSKIEFLDSMNNYIGTSISFIKFNTILDNEDNVFYGKYKFKKTNLRAKDTLVCNKLSNNDLKELFYIAFDSSNNFYRENLPLNIDKYGNLEILVYDSWDSKKIISKDDRVNFIGRLFRNSNFDEHYIYLFNFKSNQFTLKDSFKNNFIFNLEINRDKHENIYFQNTRKFVYNTLLYAGYIIDLNYIYNNNNCNNNFIAKFSAPPQDTFYEAFCDTTYYEDYPGSDIPAFYRYIKHKKPSISFSFQPDTPILAGNEIQIQAKTDAKIFWTQTDSSLSHRIKIFEDTTIFYNLIDSSGCKFRDSLKIKSIQTDSLELFTAFTPNGDDVNETYFIDLPESFALIYWRIVNRQGEQLYETFDRNGQWDGTYRGSAQP
ncbi:MAG: gliding motility-associated C-terminal domain-containing protein, partial [Chitinophagales bacterium]|nr:gliding motility-associated C-terminal domain-containing protein [Chitinophagales bacterium]